MFSRCTSKIKKEVILMKQILEYVKKYCDAGLRMFPTYRGSKVPMKDFHWKEEATKDYQVLEILIQKNNFKNLALLAGKENNIFVLDVDKHHNGYETLTQLEQKLGKLPETVTVITGQGGRHFYFEYPDGYDIVGKPDILGRGIDSRTEGNYAMIPPSIHENGEQYQWEKGKSIFEMERAKLPQAWLDALVEASNKSKDSTNTTNVDNAIISYTLQKGNSIMMLPNVFIEGNRNNSLHRVACSLVYHVNSQEELLARLKEININNCNPPLPEKEVENIVKSAWNSNSKNKTYNIKKDVELFSATELWNTELPEIQWVIPDFLGEGLNILAGDPKTGKSWFALNLASAVASGTSFLGKNIPEAKKVLYLALEDSKHRLKSRLQMIAEILRNKDNLIMSLDVGQMKTGGLENLEKAIIDKGVKLIIIDTWFKFRGIVHMGSSANAYEKDYCTLADIKTLADKYHVAILLVHHMKKGKEDNIFLEMSGSAGYAGASDSMYILEQHDQATKKLTYTGRDIIEDEMYLTLDENCIYHYDNATPQPTPFDTLSPEKREIAQIFKDTGELYNCKQIASMIHKAEGTVRQHLTGLTKEGFLIKVKTGIYKYNPDNFYEQQYNS